ncbi:MAG TPA: hypothetical protein VKO43_08720 [Candidatus Krumholzibacteriaceae bacterium]|nr:hypothetical protein [Candidatus Krumholzibacteriaceae bacterium]
MKKAVLVFLVLLLSASLAGSVSATYLENLVLNADCEGWSATGDAITGRDSMEVIYTVELYQGETLIESYSGDEFIYAPDLTFSYAEMWSSELCGEYTVEGEFGLVHTPGYIIGDTASVSFICECPPPDVCTGTPGYWKNHADAWPVDALKMGGATYSKDDLLDIFSWKPKNNRHIKLFHHLVAAKLNIINGATCDGIDDAVAMADDFFMLYPLGTNIDKKTMKMIDELKEPLEMFNESSPCGEGIEIEEEEQMLGSGYNEEKTSWGAVKSIYK